MEEKENGVRAVTVLVHLRDGQDCKAAGGDGSHAQDLAAGAETTSCEAVPERGSMGEGLVAAEPAEPEREMDGESAGRAN